MWHKKWARRLVNSVMREATRQERWFLGKIWRNWLFTGFEKKNVRIRWIQSHSNWLFPRVKTLTLIIFSISEKFIASSMDRNLQHRDNVISLAFNL